MGILAIMLIYVYSTPLFVLQWHHFISVMACPLLYARLGIYAIMLIDIQGYSWHRRLSSNNSMCHQKEATLPEY